MKFSTKLTLSITTLIFLLFSLGGHLMIQQSFDYAREEAQRQFAKEHISQRLLLENHLFGKQLDDQKLTAQDVVQAAKSTNHFRGLALYDQQLIPLYSSLVMEDPDVLKKLIKNERAIGNQIDTAYHDKYLMTTFTDYKVVDLDGKQTMFIYTRLTALHEPLYMVNTYDVSYVYEERKRQYIHFLYIDALILILAAISVLLLSRLMTSPLKKLTKVSEEIANGAYDRRIRLDTPDEIGLVAQSFDKMADAVESKIHELERMVQARDDFVSNFSHELKTPMTTMMGYADLLRSRENERELQIKAADYIYKETKRLSELGLKLMDLMSLSEEYIQKECVPVTKMIGDAGEHVEFAHVFVDRILIQSVLHNLKQNAEQAEASEIHVSGKISNQGYIVTVWDNGKGIPEHEIERIKEPFYQIDPSRTSGRRGSGLGLALCEKILKAHGAELEISSQVGKGTSVSFKLECCE